MSITVAAAAAVVGGALSLAEKIFQKAAPVLQDIASGVSVDEEKIAELRAIVARNEAEIESEEARWDSMAPRVPTPPE